MSLEHSTLRADAAREACACVQDCSGCSHDGKWHNHPDEVCALHPDTLVDPHYPGRHRA